MVKIENLKENLAATFNNLILRCAQDKPLTPLRSAEQSFEGQAIDN